VISRDWEFDNPDEDAEKEKMADFFNFVLDKMRGSFLSVLENILTSKQNGYSVNEIVWQPVDYEGKQMWGVWKIKLRPYDSFEFFLDTHGNIQKLEQVYGLERIVIQPEKYIHHVNRADVDEVFGQSDLRAAYRPYWEKDIINKFWNIHLERHGSGFMWASQEGALNTENRAALENLLKNITARTGAIVPKDVELHIEHPTDTKAFQEAINQKDRAMARAILMPNLLGLTDQGKVGSFSQSDTQLKVFLWILKSDTKALEETLNEQFFKPLAVFNFGTEDFPKFKFNSLSAEQINDIAEVWSKLIQTGAAERSDSDEDWIRELMGVPEKDEATVAKPETPNIPNKAKGDDPLNDINDDNVNDDFIEGQTEEKKLSMLKCFEHTPWLSRVDFARQENLQEDEYESMLSDLSDELARAHMSIDKQVSKLVGEKSFGAVNPKAVETINFPKKQMAGIRRTLTNHLHTTLDESTALARKELPSRRMASLIPTGMDLTKAERFVQSKSFKITGDVTGIVESSVKGTLQNAIRYDWTLNDTINQINRDVGEYLPEYDAIGRPVSKIARIETIARTSISDAVNNARQSLFESDELRGFVQAFEYSAIMDDRTTDVCAYLDTKIRRDFGDQTPPNHYNCRSILIPVTVADDWDGKQDPVGAKVGTPHKGFGITE
jgi:SPP1 gp7 family putative phage head morphogenesis protein